MMDTRLAELSADACECGIASSFLENAMFLMVMILFSYHPGSSKTPMMSWAVAFCVSVVSAFAMSEIMLRGITFCWISLGSVFL